MLYRVVQPSGVRSRLDVAAGRLTRFVGRESRARRRSSMRWERVGRRRGAERARRRARPGSGSRGSCYQLREQLARSPHTWLECRRSPYTEGTPFHPVIALVAQGLAFHGGGHGGREAREDRARARARLASRETKRSRCSPTGSGYRSCRLRPLAHEPRRAAAQDDGDCWRVESHAQRELQPLVLLVEDLHWCDAVVAGAARAHWSRRARRRACCCVAHGAPGVHAARGRRART